MLTCAAAPAHAARAFSPTAQADLSSPAKTHAVQRWRSALLGGGIHGNEELTARTGVLLLVLFAVLGVTILRIRQLIWLHLFLGFVLLGPVLLKLASTGYRFTRYYARSAVYMAKGPPHLAMRAMGPVVVLSTAIVFVSGIVLMFLGPSRRSTALLIHKASFIVWLALMGLHVLGHLPSLGPALRATGSAASRATGPGSAGRWLALAGAIVGGVVLAIFLIGHFGAWTAPGAFPREHE